MPEFDDGRGLLQALRENLEEWVSAARVEAYEELFQGEDPLLTEDELALLDGIDSHLSRETGEGVWGTDEYGLVEAGLVDEERAPRVVCTYHPEVPQYVSRAYAPLDDPTREEMNEALWEYAERVADLVERDVEAFVQSSAVAAWEE